jgi:molybdate transport system regulatory protein
MSRRKDKDTDPERHARPGVRTKIFVREDMIGGGKIELLRRVGQEGSISAAAKSMGLGYRRAWFLLDTMQRCFAEPLFISERGGAASGGSQLTELGAELVRRHDEHEASIEVVSAGFLKWLELKQADDER